MRCYYLENGGPHQSLLSVDKLCREGEYTYIHTKWGAHIIDTEGNPVNLIADGGLQYLPTVTNDSPFKCDDKLATQGQAQIQGYSTTINRHTRARQPRLGPCDNEGFREMLRGSTSSQPPVVPRGWANPSRYAILQVDHEDTTADFVVPEVWDREHPASPVTCNYKECKLAVRVRWVEGVAPSFH